VEALHFKNKSKELDPGFAGMTSWGDGISSQTPLERQS
jgi:hypothetical protein